LTLKATIQLSQAVTAGPTVAAAAGHIFAQIDGAAFPAGAELFFLVINLQSIPHLRFVRRLNSEYQSHQTLLVSTLHTAHASLYPLSTNLSRISPKWTTSPT
jgi:hypothetical protein